MLGVRNIIPALAAAMSMGPVSNSAREYIKRTEKPLTNYRMRSKPGTGRFNSSDKVQELYIRRAKWKRSMRRSRNIYNVEMGGYHYARV